MAGAVSPPVPASWAVMDRPLSETLKEPVVPLPTLAECLRPATVASLARAIGPRGGVRLVPPSPRHLSSVPYISTRDIAVYPAPRD
jgi:hypothetical protein